MGMAINGVSVKPTVLVNETMGVLISLKLCVCVGAWMTSLARKVRWRGSVLCLHTSRGGKPEGNKGCSLHVCLRQMADEH